MHTDSQRPAVEVTEADGTGPGLRRGTRGARAARATRDRLSRSSRPPLYIYQGRGVNENDGRRNAREGGETQTKDALIKMTKEQMQVNR